jgi:hypothetical protein
MSSLLVGKMEWTWTSQKFETEEEETEKDNSDVTNVFVH